MSVVLSVCLSVCLMVLWYLTCDSFGVLGIENSSSILFDPSNFVFIPSPFQSCYLFIPFLDGGLDYVGDIPFMSILSQSCLCVLYFNIFSKKSVLSPCLFTFCFCVKFRCLMFDVGYRCFAVGQFLFYFGSLLFRAILGGGVYLCCLVISLFVDALFSTCLLFFHYLVYLLSASFLILCDVLPQCCVCLDSSVILNSRLLLFIFNTV